jgi:hypothetical protein
MKKIIIVLLALVLVSVALAQTISFVSDKVQKLDDCRNIYWEEEEKVYGTCSDLRIKTECEDPPYNTSCTDTLEPYSYTCLKDTKIVQKSRQECKTNAYIVNEIIKLHTKDYVCSTEEEDNRVIVICDHRLDSNRDGKCKPGESCMKFVIDGENIEQYEKNSRYDWVAVDKSFFLDRIQAEVLK